ncbi:acyl-CoA thioesterase [Legionella londiniensis]|uniref:Thiesterase n=1 Tax=Legionella londiniensis TaxID=45068 RepID=A0A0W0VHB2_9GAMM|nr:thioesterase family protein [Legionella londiniensis]KTD19540.1 Thiesterase [Legionella londiniensis]STX92239.1 Thiesterase [Legionella londiniensis]
MSNEAITVHQKTFAIAWGDMDALGHVNNGRYFDYFQEARIEWLKSLGLDLQRPEGPVVVHVAATFLKPLIYPATVTITSSISQLGRSSILMEHKLHQDDTLMTEGISKIVWVNYQKNKSVPLPLAIRDLYPREN